MGVSKKFIRFLRSGHAFCFIVLLLCLVLPGHINAQDDANDKIVTVNGKKYYKHIVVKKETIYGIAEKFNLKPKDVVLENPSAIDGVHPGDVLLIPIVSVPKQADTTSASTEDVKEGNYIYHTVAGKETLYSLTKKYNTTVIAIDSLNPDIAVKGLQKGKKIRIPVAQSNSPVISKQQEKHTASKDTVKIAQANTNKKEAQAYKSLFSGHPNSDTSKILKDTGRQLNRYNIALIMPFASEGIDTMRLNRLLDGTSEIPSITRVSVDFYHGFVMALDSLAKRGFKANLHVFNVGAGTDTSSHTSDSVLRNPEMLKMNLIIGPPFPSNFKRAGWFAAKHHIPIVSPLSPENSVLKFNPWTSKATPSPVTETEVEADYIAKHYSHTNIIIIHNKSVSNEYYEAFKKQFHKTDSTLGNNDTLRHTESTGGVNSLGNKIIKTLVNIIVVPYPGAPFVAKFVNELANSNYATDDSLVLFGMHNWANNDALAADNLDTLNFHFPSNEFVNYADVPTRKFIIKYRNNYLSEPGKYSYEGFDLGMFFGTLLQTYGTGIQSHLSDMKYTGLQSSFNMFQDNPFGGYENKAVYILEYKNYTEKLDSR